METDHISRFTNFVTETAYGFELAVFDELITGQRLKLFYPHDAIA